MGGGRCGVNVQGRQGTIMVPWPDRRLANNMEVSHH